MEWAGGAEPRGMRKGAGGRRVAVIGLGVMGLPVAKTLIGAGLQVAGFDVRPDPAAALLAAGGESASSPAAAARGAEALLVLVQNFAQVRAALLGETGALAALPPAALVILMSTVAPAEARELAGWCEERGLCALDAPMSGGVTAAAAGTLSIMVGGPAATLAAARPLLEIIGDPARIWHVGPRAGDGQSMKMINQLMACVNIAASAEAMALAARSGLDLRQVYEIVSQSAGGSWMFRDRVPRMIDRAFTPPRSVLDIQVKDLGIVVDTADELGMPVFLAAVARQVYKLAAAAGLGPEDDSGLIRLYEGLGTPGTAPGSPGNQQHD